MDLVAVDEYAAQQMAGRARRRSSSGSRSSQCGAGCGDSGSCPAMARSKTTVDLTVIAGCRDICRVYGIWAGGRANIIATLRRGTNYLSLRSSLTATAGTVADPDTATPARHRRASRRLRSTTTRASLAWSAMS